MVDRSCAPDCAQQVHRRSASGTSDGGLAPELQRDGRAADRWRSGRVRDSRRRTRCARIRRGFRSVDRQRGLALLDGSRRGASLDRKRGTGAASIIRAASTWMTGVVRSRAAAAVLATGNPSPDYNGDDRLGDNLYASSVVALDAETGKLKWHYQFTPHNVWDWDAQQPTVLVDTTWRAGRASSWCRPAGTDFFTCSTAPTEKCCLRQPFVKSLTWAERLALMGVPCWFRTGPDHGGHQHLPVLARRGQLVFASGTARHRALLRADARELQHLRQERERVGGREVYMGGSTRQTPGGAEPENSARHRREDRKDRVGTAADRSRRGARRHAGDGERARIFLRRSGPVHGRRCVNAASRCGNFPSTP